MFIENARRSQSSYPNRCQLNLHNREVEVEEQEEELEGRSTRCIGMCAKYIPYSRLA